MKTIFFTLISMFVAVCASTAGCAEAQEVAACGELSEAYFKKPLRQTIDEFKTHDLETQYSIYICGNQFRHPPALHLAAPFASQGEPAAIFLKQKLATATGIATIRDILNVYAEMQRQHTYDVKGDTSLLLLFDQKISTIRDSYWRKYCDGIVGEIKGR
jgi:hypothetical protein